MLKKQKGSIPLVAIVIIATALTIIALSNLLIAENVSNKKYNLEYENDLYSTRNALEGTENVVLQKLSENEKPYQQQSTFIIDNTELQQMQNALNASILPYIDGGTTVTLKNLKYDKSLDMLCTGSYGINPNTNQQEITGVNCNATYFYMSFDLDITNSKGTSHLNVKFNNLYPEESQRSGYMKVNYSSVQIDVSGL